MAGGAEHAMLAGMAEQQRATERVAATTTTDTKAPAPRAAEKEAPAAKADEVPYLCSCGEKVSGDKARDSHRKDCQGQWLAEPAKA